MKNLREAAGVSEDCMNRVYDLLRQLSPAHLRRMWLAADPYEPLGALVRYQILFTVEKALAGEWELPEGGLS